MTPLQAAHMELKEELRFDTKLTFQYKTLLTCPNEKHFASLFWGKYPRGTKITLDPEESDEYQFITKSELKKMKKMCEPYSYKTIIEFFSKKH